MSFAGGAFRSLAINEESVFGTPVAAGGQYINRVTATPDLTKDVYRSNAIRTDQQIAVSRHGMRKVGGPINCELNPGEYKRIIQALVRKDFVTGATTGAVAVIATTANTFHRSAGSFLTNAFKVGSIIAKTGDGGGGAVDNAKRVVVTAVTATDVTFTKLDGSAPGFAVNAEGSTVTVAEVGKVTMVPSSGHTDKSFSIESWYADILQSEQLTGSKFTSADFKLPTTGLATVDFSVLGKDMLRNTTQQFTTPSSPATAPGLASVNGVVLIQGVPVGILNSLDFKLDGQGQTDGVVGSNTTPFVWMGPLLGSGNFTAFFQDAAFRDYFIDETEIGIIAVFTTSNANNADFMSFRMPRVKVNGATKDDKQTGGIKLTGTIELLRNTAGGAGTTSDDTTIAIQDSLA